MRTLEAGFCLRVNMKPTLLGAAVYERYLMRSSAPCAGFVIDNIPKGRVEERVSHRNAVRIPVVFCWQTKPALSPHRLNGPG